MSYASKTKVPVDRSRAGIERLLQRAGADQFVMGWDQQKEARVQCRLNNKLLRFALPMPNQEERGFRSQSGYEQEVRRRWRALSLVIKAKLEAVSSGIAAFEEEFLAHIVMPDGKTVAEHTLPLIETTYKSGKAPAALLPGW
jgi:hypothetical protein